MKKRTRLIFLALFVCLILAACSTKAPAAEVTDSVQSETASVSEAEAPTLAPTEAPTEAPKEQTEPVYEITYVSASGYKDSIGTVWLQGIVSIVNTGEKDLYLNSGSADFEDGSGTLLTTEGFVSAYPEIIAKGETGYMYVENMYDGELPDSVVLVPHESVDLAKVDLLRLPTSDVTVKDRDYGGVSAMGRVENNTAEDISFVYVCVVLKDASGNPICVLMTIVDEIKAGDKVGFEAVALSVPDTLTAETVASFEVFAYPMQMQF